MKLTPEQIMEQTSAEVVARLLSYHFTSNYTPESRAEVSAMADRYLPRVLRMGYTTQIATIAREIMSLAMTDRARGGGE